MKSLPPQVQTQTSSPHKPLCVLKYILKYSEVEETHEDHLKPQPWCYEHHTLTRVPAWGSTIWTGLIFQNTQLGLQIQNKIQCDRQWDFGRILPGFPSGISAPAAQAERRQDTLILPSSEMGSQPWGMSLGPKHITALWGAGCTSDPLPWSIQGCG